MKARVKKTDSTGKTLSVSQKPKKEATVSELRPKPAPKAKKAEKPKTPAKKAPPREKPAPVKEPVQQQGADFISDYDLYLLQEGTHMRAYEKLGAHLTGGGTHFAVWAPNASRVAVIGDFNEWNEEANPLSPRGSSGIWTGFFEGVKQGALYKYAIWSKEGHRLPDKADPYAFYSEQRPYTASVVWPLPKYTPEVKDGQSRHDPISIYEVHLGSWRRADDNRMLSYQELAETLIPYVKEMGFTHLELMPVSEYPFDGSWGYQPTGLFAPTSRFGNPDEFRDFVAKAHEAGLHVLVDWVPGHFPNDAHGLTQFDGSHLYEHQDPREGRHMDWDTLIYNYGRTEVTNFLISNGLFWIERYGVDGLRVDAVASMIYRNYSRGEGQWIPNQHGGVENLEAITFLRRMNEQLFGQHPKATTIAEESTAFPGVSQPTDTGGLGFGFKWNMGWMHDTLKYMSEDPIHRRYHHNQLTFGLLYAFSENFVLPLSHDEVVHGKGSLIGKMPGDEWQRFANLRAYYGFMFGHPGKKLLFMGGEFAQYAEWNHDQSLDWHLLDHASHQGVQRLVKDLNHLYKTEKALHVHDCEESGFEWLESDAEEMSVLAFLRKGDTAEEIAVVVSNFTPVPRQNYRVPVPLAGFYEERLNTDSAHYGGSNMGNGGGIHSEPVAHHGRPHSLLMTLPPLSTVILTYKREA